MRDLYIKQVEAQLRERFAGLIDMSDPAAQRAADPDSTWLSRALAALTVVDATGCDPEHAARCVIDGFDDEGIDAIAVDIESPHVWIVQAKYSSVGTAGFDQQAMFSLKAGLDLLVKHGEYHRFNNKLQPLVDDLATALANPGVRLTVILALAGEEDLSPNLRLRCADLTREYNEINRDFMKIEVMRLGDFVRVVRSDTRVRLEARIEDLKVHREPFPAYHGTITADQIADWHTQYRHRLFKRNIRHPLGLTPVNSEIVECLVKTPELFWYFHNGITVLCDTVPMMGPLGDLRLDDASVVNGAQTVASIQEAHSRAPESLKKASLGIRIIPLQGTPTGFDSRVTIATNTQNGVIQQDFRALDRIQERLRYGFQISLDKQYVIKRGEKLRDSREGSDMAEAAMALACAHPDSRISYRATSDSRRLWDNDTYFEIFKGREAKTVWRCVQLHRRVEEKLRESREEREGRAEQLADQGAHLIAHLVFQSLPGWQKADEEQWTRLRESVGQVTADAFRRAIYTVDTEVGPSSHISSLFRSSERYETVARAAAEAIRAGRPVPELAANYQVSESEGRARKARAVSVIVEAEAIEEGTALEFRPVTGPERSALAAWVAEDPRRGRATWARDKSKPLLWELDGLHYSPSNLVMEIFRRANKKSPKAVQGTRRWFVPERGSLVEIADQERAQAE
ncbi:AIPR family protein [Streptomyces phytohabitans]|uniref:AIPR family protein n=1 Tax=Streptomyces phytohabitans TaxID=1150371 RepID=UPI00345B9F04